MADGLSGRLEHFLKKFTSYFTIKNSESHEVYSSYLKGLFVTNKRNCERMGHHVEHNSQSLNHFISNSPWNWEMIGERLYQLFIAMLPTAWLKDVCLTIDESGFPKKGKSSVGVAHQYCGQLGKNANCQVGVFSGLVCRGFYCLLQAVLYLPKSWCEKEGTEIPRSRKLHQSKIEIANQLIRQAITLKIPFHWVNFDSFYGRDQKFLIQLNEEKVIFVADIPKNATLFLSKPEVFIPANNKNKRGRLNTRYKIIGDPKTAEQVALDIPHVHFKLITVRKNHTCKPVKANYAKVNAFIVHKDTGATLQTVLLIRKDLDGKISYILSNDITSNTKRLAFMQCQRYFIERSFQELKQDLGLNEYQIRGYNGWHKHMYMCMIAHLSIEIEKMNFLKENFYTTTPKMKEIYELIIQHKKRSIKDILDEFIDLQSNIQNST